LRTTGVLLLVLFLVVTYYIGFYDGLALFSAGVWSMINLIFLSALVRATLRPDGVNKSAVAVLAIVKFPLYMPQAIFYSRPTSFAPYR